MSLLSAKQLAIELGVCLNTVKRAYQQKEIPVERIGRVFRFDLERVREAMRRRALEEARGKTKGSVRIGDNRSNRISRKLAPRSRGSR